MEMKLASSLVVGAWGAANHLSRDFSIRRSSGSLFRDFSISELWILSNKLIFRSILICLNNVGHPLWYCYPEDWLK